MQMTSADGLLQWADGAYTSAVGSAETTSAPVLSEAHRKECLLWVVRQDDVVYAAEHGAFGKTLETGIIKHTNLTGGAAAFSGGEMLILEDKTTLVVNGRSGRYGPKSANEMHAVATAFARSGYRVWSMGYDADTDKPLPFIGVRPQWVQ